MCHFSRACGLGFPWRGPPNWIAAFRDIIDPLKLIDGMLFGAISVIRVSRQRVVVGVHRWTSDSVIPRKSKGA
jgi:hypothetical protein